MVPKVTKGGPWPGRFRCCWAIGWSLMVVPKDGTPGWWVGFPRVRCGPLWWSPMVVPKVPKQGWSLARPLPLLLGHRMLPKGAPQWWSLRVVPKGGTQEW